MFGSRRARCLPVKGDESMMRKMLGAGLVAAVCAVGAGVLVGAAAKPSDPTIYPTVAEFADGGIRNDGRGPYYDGIDGVSSYRVAGSGTTNGWAFDLKARRATEPRTLTYDLNNPSWNSPPQGVITINDTHGQIYDLSTMAVNEVKYVRAAFHLIVNRVEYVLRFGQTPNDRS